MNSMVSGNELFSFVFLKKKKKLFLILHFLSRTNSVLKTIKFIPDTCHRAV